MIKRIITKIIIEIGKYFVRDTTELDKKLVSQYNKEKSLIKRLYSNPLYWHGTGRYHHNNKGKIDVLKGMILKNGLQPLVKDPWLKSQGDYKYSISLSNIRMYASVYALIHLEENSDIYLFGKRFIWSMLVGLINFVQEPIDILYHALLFTFKKGKGKIKGFQSKVRKVENLQDLKTFVFQLMYMPNIRSDIKNNYPILIAIKSKTVEEVKMDSGFDYYEVRTEDPIPFNKISHIEVPLANIKETREILNKQRINLKVISIESAEQFIKKQSTHEEQLTPTPRKLLPDILNKEIYFPYSFKKLNSFKKFFHQNTFLHKYPHALRCYYYAGLIASQYPEIDSKVVCLASFFHDVSKRRIFNRNHGSNSSKWVLKHLNLKEFKLTQEQKNKIIELCKQHNTKDSRDISLELQIVKDSDSLDRWRLPFCKTKQEYLRTDTAKEINKIIKDFVKRYNAMNIELPENEKLILCSKYFGINID